MDKFALACSLITVSTSAVGFLRHVHRNQKMKLVPGTVVTAHEAWDEGGEGRVWKMDVKIHDFEGLPAIVPVTASAPWHTWHVGDPVMLRVDPLNQTKPEVDERRFVNTLFAVWLSIWLLIAYGAWNDLIKYGPV